MDNLNLPLKWLLKQRELKCFSGDHKHSGLESEFNNKVFQRIVLGIDDATVIIRQVEGMVADEDHTNTLNYDDTNGTATISASDGTAPYTFAKGAGACQVSGLFTGLAAGAYTFHAKDADSCISDVTVIIGQPEIVVADEDDSDSFCYGSFHIMYITELEDKTCSIN